MSTTDDFQDRGEAARRAAGIDGTAGDAQDIRHHYAEDPDGGCLLCGLTPGHRQHIDRPLSCGFCFEEDGQEIHPHPECAIGADGTFGVRMDLLTVLFEAEAARQGPVDVLAVAGREAAQEAAAVGILGVVVADVLGVACGAVDTCGAAGGFAPVLEVVSGGHGFS